MPPDGATELPTIDVPGPARPPARRRRRGRIDRGLGLVTWTLLAALVALLTFAYALPQRLTDAEPHYARLAAVAFFGRVFTFHAGLLLATCLGVALVLRRWRLAAVATVGVALTLGPTLARCAPHSNRTAGVTVRVLAMNTKYTNADPADVVAQIRCFNPDLVAVEELGVDTRRAIDAALAGGEYPFRCPRPGGYVGLGIWSRLPFEAGPPQISVAGIRRQVRVVVRIGDQRVALYVVHPISPRNLSRLVHNRFAAADLADQVRREQLPVILAGDFNFTAETPNAAALTAAGLHDAFDDAGRGRASTWPVSPPWLGWLPGVRIDHVYLSPGLACTCYATGGYMGSDHLPIIADVGLARSDATPSK